MIHEIRTYSLRTSVVPEYQKRFYEKLPGRQEFSPLGGHWYTDVGPLNQLVAIWPYDSLEQRADIRQRAEAGPNPKWPPDTGDLIISMKSEIYTPAPFMTPLGERKIGPVYELRIYSFPQEGIPRVLEAWGKAMPAREKLSPLAGCWYSGFGGVNNFVHLWAYKSADERMRVRAEAVESGIWPPKSGVPPTMQENKVLLPAWFSPMQ